MNLRWLWYNHVPPGVELTQDQEREMRRRIKTIRRAKPFMANVVATLVAAFGGAGVTAALFGIGMHYLVRHRPAGITYAVDVVTITLGYMILLQVVIAAAIGRYSAPFVRAALNEMGIPVCMKCGYNLDHLQSNASTCPECGSTKENPSVMR